MSKDLEVFREIAWRDFILFAAQDKGIIAHYEHETGREFFPALGPIDILIDRATGHDPDDQQAEHFVLWVTEHHWGTDEAPAKVREKLATRERREV